MPTKTEAIRNFLRVKTRPELAELYTPEMECQVNAAQDEGEAVEGDFKGHKWRGFTDGATTWKPIRIPYRANTPTPEFNDSAIRWDLAQHAEGVGMTGWNWVQKRSYWVAFDFDAIVGHSEKHKKKLTPEEMEQVQRLCCEIPWTTIRRSTSGNGLHIYVFMDGFPTETHTEHAAMGRAILGRMSAIVGFDFDSKVDNCFSGDTEFITHDGVFTLRELAGKTVKVLQLTPTGEKWVSAEIRSFGVQKTYPLDFGNSSTVRATADHRWLTVKCNGTIDLWDRKYTSELTKQTRLPLARRQLPSIDWEGFAHGFVFGDGWLVDYHGEQQAEVAFFGPKRELVDKIVPYGRSVGSRDYRGQQEPMVYGLPALWKQLPENPTKEYALGFILGLHSADGRAGKKGGLQILQSNRETLKAIQKLAVWIGLRARDPRLDSFGDEPGKFANAEPSYCLYIETYNIEEWMIARRDHRKNFVCTRRNTTHAVVGSDVREEEVFCAVTPDYRNFTLANGVVTSNCGNNIWVWHRKFDSAGGIEGPGLKLIKKGDTLDEQPLNWRDHVKVTSGARRKSIPGFVTDLDPFEELCGQRQRVPLDDVHRKLIAFLESTGSLHWFDQDHHMLVCHTYDLAQAHESLGMRGIFKTVATGRLHGGDQNCFCFPGRRGSWSVRRHTPGVGEAETWEQDGSGWTRCYLNREPDLKTAARAFGGLENDRYRFQFREAEVAQNTLQALGARVDIPAILLPRPTTLRPHSDGRLILEIERQPSDSPDKMAGWIDEKKVWRKVLSANIASDAEPEIGNFDDLIRHLVTETGEDLGWVVKSDGKWCEEPLAHVKLGLKYLGKSPKELDLIMGSGVVKRWTVVNRPFQPEYIGDRQWNRNPAQLAFPPNPDTDNLQYPHWTRVFNHCGCGLDAAIKEHGWCKAHGIHNGGDYLRLWLASLIQKPMKSLPFLFFYGPQGSGKSIFWESIARLITRGVVRADGALVNQAGFNGELDGAVLCVIEEVDLRKSRSTAYNRAKDWTTAPSIQIERKGGTPYTIPNTLHFVQLANDIEYGMVMSDDTRITVCYVPPLDPTEYITREDLMRLLDKEASDFLASLLATDIPQSPDRVNVPVIVTDEKRMAVKLSANELEQFLTDKTFAVTGESIKYGELFESFLEWLPGEAVGSWTQVRVGRELMKLGYPKGRDMKRGANWYIGNISWTPGEAKPRLKMKGESLVSE